ncbi:MAG: alpha/beta fold hydrolase [Actinomycetota bacterium]
MRRIPHALALATALALALSGCGAAAPPEGSTRITITTSTGIDLDAIELGGGPKVAVLSHGATGTKEDFYPVAEAFAADGWRVIAYDAPGVGESTGTNGRDREEALTAVVDHARETGTRAVVLVGGSMGAGLSLAMAAPLRADAVVSLSAPATAYDALDAAHAMPDDIAAFVAAAEDNEPYASEARDIADAAGVAVVIVSGSGHGSGVFNGHPELLVRVIAWADEAVAGSGTNVASAEASPTP